MSTMPSTTRDEDDGHSSGDTGLDVVTGAFSYSGRAIARRLLEEGPPGHWRRAVTPGEIRAD